MGEYQRTFLQEYRAHERIISRQNIKELAISALRRLPVSSVKDTFVQESNINDETFQRFSSKKFRLHRLRALRDEKSFKKLPFERKNNSPSCLPLPLALPVSKTNVMKVSSFPAIKAKNVVIRTASLVKSGPGSKSKNPSPVNPKDIQQEINSTKTIKSKAHAEKEYELNNVSGVGLPIRRPDFPSDISCIHPVSEFSFAPDDFSFTVPESIQKLPYRPSFIPTVPNLPRVSTPVPFKVQKEDSTSVNNKTHSKFTKPLANVINKIAGMKNLASKKSPVLSETRILPKGKTTFQFDIAKNSFGRHSLAAKPQNQRKSLFQNGLENKSTHNLKISNKENTCVGSKVSPVNLLDKKTDFKVMNPTNGGFRATYRSRASLLPSDHKNNGANRPSMAAKEFGRLQCNSSSSKQPNQQKSISKKVKANDLKLTNASFRDSIKNQQRKLNSTVEIQKSYTKTLLKPSASLANMNSNMASSDSNKNRQKELSVEKQENLSKTTVKLSVSLANVNGKTENYDIKRTNQESLKNLSNKSVSEHNDSSVNVVVINKNCMDNTFGTHQDVQNVIELKKMNESSENLLGNETSDLNISLMRKNIENFIDKDPDKITERKKITHKDVFRNSFSLMSTCFIDDEILDDAISAEIAALDLSSSINMAGDTPLRNTKIFSLIDSPFGKPFKSSLKFLNEVKSPWRSAITLESIKKNKSFLADETKVATNNGDVGSVFDKKMVSDASNSDYNSSCGRNNFYREDKTPLQSQRTLYCNQHELVSRSNIQRTVPERDSPIMERSTFDISLLGTPFKPSGINNVSIRGDLITFSPIVNGVM